MWIPSTLTAPGRDPWGAGPAPAARSLEFGGESPTAIMEQAYEPRATADRLFHSEGLSMPPEDSAAPYSLQWFLAIEHHRYNRRTNWIPQLLEFSRHAGESLVGLGAGLGTDWLQYARHGAKVTVCSASSADLSLVRRNFELRGLNGRYIHAQPSALPLADASVDVVCMNGVLHESSEPAAVVREIYRILKPGGKILAVLPARYHVDYWKKIFFPWSRISAGQQRELLNNDWAHGHGYASPAPSFSRRGLKRLFNDFAVHRVHKRHLRRREVPLPWRWLPMHLLQRLFGRYLILKAFKPITVPVAARMAA